MLPKYIHFKFVNMRPKDAALICSLYFAVTVWWRRTI